MSFSSDNQPKTRVVKHARVINPVPGMRYFQLVFGEKTTASDPRVTACHTPVSYLAQGSLRECFCDCGALAFVSDYVLRKGNVKSCGHVRADQLRGARKTYAPRGQLVDLKNQIRIERSKHVLARLSHDLAAEDQSYKKLLDLYNAKKAAQMQIAMAGQTQPAAFYDPKPVQVAPGDPLPQVPPYWQSGEFNFPVKK